MSIEDKLISFQNFLIVATADGALSDEEKEVLIGIGEDMGLTPEDLKETVNATTLSFKLHDNKEDNLADLGDMLTIAASDGVVYEVEYNTCLDFAKLAGISQTEFDDLYQIALNDLGEDVVYEV